jgi:hypothetical protein
LHQRIKRRRNKKSIIEKITKFSTYVSSKILLKNSQNITPSPCTVTSTPLWQDCSDSRTDPQNIRETLSTVVHRYVGKTHEIWKFEQLLVDSKSFATNNVEDFDASKDVARCVYSE